MVGLPCSGKATLARKLEYERSALRLTPDEWQLRLFGQDADDPEHDVRHGLIEALLWKVASRALVLGTNVILDSVAGGRVGALRRERRLRSGTPPVYGRRTASGS